MPRHPPPEPELARVRAMFAGSPSARPVVSGSAGHRQAVSGRVPRASGDRPAGWVPEIGGLIGLADGAWMEEGGDLDEADEGSEGAGERVGPPGRHRSPEQRRAPRVLTVPGSLRGARVHVSWRAVIALALVVVGAGLVFVVRVAWAEQSSTPQVVPRAGVTSPRSVPAGFTGAGGGTSVPATSSATTRPALVIDVIGQVLRPGVVTVTEGARVVDVLAAAGGALAGADLGRLNLARVVADGEQVFVPRPGESPPAGIGPMGGGAGVSTSVPGAAGSGSTIRVIDLNAASMADLDSLPGVGPVLAQRILDWRQQHGRFTTVDELGEVSGVGDKLLEQLRPRVRV